MKKTVIKIDYSKSGAKPTNKIYKEISGILFCPRVGTLLNLPGKLSKGHKNYLERSVSAQR